MEFPWRFRSVRAGALGARSKTFLACWAALACCLQWFMFVAAGHSQTVAPAWSFEGDQPGARFGFSVCSAGDVNGDGYSDVLVGAPDKDNGQSDEGAAYLFLGSPAGPSLAPDWTTESDQTGARFGACVASAGDVNGDGYSDVLVGAPDYDDGQDDEGAVFLYLGSAGGLAPAPARVWQGDQAGGHFGSSVCSAGDVNTDGFDDVLIGAPEFDGGESDEGAAFLFLGAASGVQSAPAWSAEGNQAGASFGSSVAALGDMNGDGFTDVVIGAPNFSGGQIAEGQARIFGGTSSGLGASPLQSIESNNDDTHLGFAVAGGGNLSGDGVPRVLYGAPTYTYTQQEEGGTFLAGFGQSPFFLSFGAQDFAHRGASIAPAGDVNADGRTDVVIGADRFDAGEEDEGRVTVHLGHPSFVVDRTPAWVVDGNQPFCAFGSSVASAGDVNGDGFGDVVVGAPQYDRGQNDEGRAFVFLGPSGTITGVEDESEAAPAVFYLNQNQPNPFNPDTRIGFGLSVSARVRLKIFDVSGRLVRVLLDGPLPAGQHASRWDGLDDRRIPVASGVYFYELEAGSFHDRKRMAILR